jgi:isopentenyldiphosphate isomerase
MVYLFEVDKAPPIIADPNEVSEYRWVEPATILPPEAPMDFLKHIEIYRRI